MRGKEYNRSDIKGVHLPIARGSLSPGTTGIQMVPAFQADGHLGCQAMV